MSRELPFLLQKFLQDTGWPAPGNRSVALRMQTALQFFHKRLPRWISLSLDETDPGYRKHGFNPFAFKVGGRVTKLTSAMQAINFNHPVQLTILGKGKIVRRFGKAGEPRGAPPEGLWYTKPEVPASRLALPPDQTTPHGYEITRDVEVLSSIAGDMLVDWKMDPELPRKPTQGVDYHYCFGGGLQYVIPNAAAVMRAL